MAFCLGDGTLSCFLYNNAAYAANVGYRKMCHVELSHGESFLVRSILFAISLERPNPDAAVGYPVRAAARFRPQSEALRDAFFYLRPQSEALWGAFSYFRLRSDVLFDPKGTSGRSRKHNGASVGTSDCCRKHFMGAVGTSDCNRTAYIGLLAQMFLGRSTALPSQHHGCCWERLHFTYSHGCWATSLSWFLYWCYPYCTLRYSSHGVYFAGPFTSR